MTGLEELKMDLAREERTHGSDDFMVQQLKAQIASIEFSAREPRPQPVKFQIGAREHPRRASSSEPAPE